MNGVRDMGNYNKLIEALANLEHEQWMKWSIDIASHEDISRDRIKRWHKYWIPYKELDEETKEFGREWAKKVIKVLEELHKKGIIMFLSSMGFHDVEEFYIE